jgi:hypothetical protein
MKTTHVCWDFFRADKKDANGRWIYRCDVCGKLLKVERVIPSKKKK